MCAALVVKAMEDRRFYRSLKQEIRKLRPMVAPRSEARALLSAL